MEILQLIAEHASGAKVFGVGQSIMPTPRTWLDRSEEILSILERMKAESLDRPAIEDLFGLQRRAAITLMRQAGAVGGRGFPSLVDRAALIDWVRSIYDAEYPLLERRRHLGEDLSRSVEEVRAVRQALALESRPVVSFPLVEQVLQATFRTLTPAVSIAPGRIVVQFPAHDPEAALSCLYELSMAMANDFDAFLSIGVAHSRTADHAQTYYGI